MRRLAQRLLGIEPESLVSVGLGFLAFLLLFAAYFMLRPVRETMGIAGGVNSLQWLFSATFVATLLAMPLFGWLSATVRRDLVAKVSLLFFASNLLVFALLIGYQGIGPYLARTFYIWVSVFNLLAVSVVWSFFADVFDAQSAKRFFGPIAAGASIGGLIGPLIGVALVGTIGHAGLLVLAAGLLVGSVTCMRAMKGRGEGERNQGVPRPIGGSPLAGALLVARSPFLLGMAAFVLLLASTTTFLYFEQARVVARHFPSAEDQTRVFAAIDVAVQALAILSQLFITGRIARRLGLAVLLAGVPLIVAAGFVWLAFVPTFAALVTVMIARRAGEYAFIRPGREMMFTSVPPAEKYQAKNFVDTVVYRGADAVSAWAKALVDVVAATPVLASLIGCALALTWAAVGLRLGRAHARREPLVGSPALVAR